MLFYSYNLNRILINSLSSSPEINIDKDMKLTKQWISPLIRLFFPHYCVVCEGRLREEEEVLCADCWQRFPRTNFQMLKDNPVERLFWGKFTLGRATAFCYYWQEDDYSRIVRLLKYDGRPDVGISMGKKMAAELWSSGFFEGIDMLIPVPLHEKRQKERGYNQSEQLALGIKEITGIPLKTDAVVRVRNTETQTHKTAQERFENMQQVFQRAVPIELLQGKHVLLIDDVLTTSATLTACADALQEVPDLTISILALAMAGH